MMMMMVMMIDAADGFVYAIMYTGIQGLQMNISKHTNAVGSARCTVSIQTPDNRAHDILRSTQ